MKASWMYYAVIFCLLSSCGPVMYVPTSCNVPLFDKRGETQINTSAVLNSFGFATTSWAIHLQGAHALTDHFAMIANYQNGKRLKRFTSRYEFNLRHYTVEGGAGYYTKLKKNYIAECYFGYGGGSIYNIGNTGFPGFYDYEMYNSSNKIFNQISIGRKEKKSEWAFSIKSSFISVERINDFGLVNALQSMRDFNHYHNFWVLEPAITSRYGKDQLIFQAQLCYSINLSYYEFPQERLNLSIGVFYRIPKQ